MLFFIDALKENAMYIHLAYTDIEGIVFSLADIDSVSIGIYEDLRHFTLKNFQEKEDKPFGGGPKRRIYSDKLFQWIDCDYLGALESIIKNWKQAMKQAYRYQSFSYETYVVLDKHYVENARNNLAMFEKFNIGLGAVETGNIEFCFKPKKKSLIVLT